MTVELLITIIVGAILVLSLNSIVASHTYLTQRSRTMVLANAFAEQQIEALRSAGYLRTPYGTKSLTNELPADLHKPRSATLAVSAESSAVKRINLTITYNEQGVQRTQSYTTFIGELGVGQY